MENVTIILNAVKNDGKYYLLLADNRGDLGFETITTKALPGSEIIWKLANDSKVKKIVNIVRDSASENVFKELPYKVSDTEFKAVVADDVAGKKEAYTIVFEYEDGTQIANDPFIEVDPT